MSNRSLEAKSNIFPGLETTFNTVAEQYDRMRPTYVEELYDNIWRYGGFDGDISAVEVGIGTGQATQPVLNRGASVTAVELGSDLAACCARKFAENPKFFVINMPFQDFTVPENSCDLIYSASASISFSIGGLTFLVGAMKLPVMMEKMMVFSLTS